MFNINTILTKKVQIYFKVMINYIIALTSHARRNNLMSFCSSDDIVGQLKAADSTLTSVSALEIVKAMYSGDFEDNQSVISFYEGNTALLTDMHFKNCS